MYREPFLLSFKFKLSFLERETHLFVELPADRVPARMERGKSANSHGTSRGRDQGYGDEENRSKKSGQSRGASPNRNMTRSVTVNSGNNQFFADDRGGSRQMSRSGSQNKSGRGMDDYEDYGGQGGRMAQRIGTTNTVGTTGTTKMSPNDHFRGCVSRKCPSYGIPHTHESSQSLGALGDRKDDMFALTDRSASNRSGDRRGDQGALGDRSASNRSGDQRGEQGE